MYRKILVPLDGSLRAEKILPHVEELALQYRASVLLLQVVEPLSSASHADIYISQKELLETRRESSESYLATVTARLIDKKIEVRSQVANGGVVEAICDISELEQIDLIAMASHGRTGAARVFYGSVAAGVLQRVDRPLLIIRSRERE